MERLIGGSYVVELGRPLPGAGGGLPTFAATDRRGIHTGLMAVRVPAGQAPRAKAIAALSADPPPGVLAPLAHGPTAGSDGVEQYFVVCGAPPGPALALRRGAGMAEAALLATVLLPAAAALDALQQRRVAHRAIRPNNLFRDGPQNAVVLGSAWAGPAAKLQPAVYEPPSVAMCHSSGRGEGCIEDDVYSLGVTLLTLALGRVPLAELDSEAMMLRKLEVGSFVALTEHERLPAVLLSLLRGMLADDPVRRPAPALLTDIMAAGARRVVSTSARRAAQPVEGIDAPVLTARALAFSMARDPERGARLLRSGVVELWLRRGLGDHALAVQIEAVQRSKVSAAIEDAARADVLLVLRAIVVLDPLAPLCWRGVALVPEGLGPLLTEVLSNSSDERAILEEIIALDVMPAWAALRAESPDLDAVRRIARLAKTWLHSRGLGGGIARVAYALTPFAQCRSKLLVGRWVAQEPDLLLALDALGREGLPDGLPMDRDMAAFVAAHADRSGENELALLLDDPKGERTALSDLRVLARLQVKLRIGPLPGLAAWLARGGLTAKGWRNRTRRRLREQGLLALTIAGYLDEMLTIIDCPVERARDARDVRRAEDAVRQIDEQVRTLRSDLAGPAARGRQLGREMAARMGIAAAGIAALVCGVL